MGSICAAPSVATQTVAAEKEEKVNEPEEINKKEEASKEVSVNIKEITVPEEHTYRSLSSNKIDVDDLKYYLTSNDEKAVATRESLIIVDVRDPKTDRLGGHIPMSTNLPYQTFVTQIPYLLKASFMPKEKNNKNENNSKDNDNENKNDNNSNNTYTDKSNVVFHCMYSQMRGPSCCETYCKTLRYICNKYYCLKNYNVDIDKINISEIKDEHLILTLNKLIDDNNEFEDIGKELKEFVNKMTDDDYDNVLNQNVIILRKGFQKWVSIYHQLKDTDVDTFNLLIADFDIKYWDKRVMDYGGGYKTVDLWHKQDW